MLGFSVDSGGDVVVGGGVLFSGEFLDVFEVVLVELGVWGFVALDVFEVLAEVEFLLP